MDQEMVLLQEKKRYFKQKVEGMSEEEFRVAVLMALDAIEERAIDIQSKWGLK